MFNTKEKSATVFAQNQSASIVDAGCFTDQGRPIKLLHPDSHPHRAHLSPDHFHQPALPPSLPSEIETCERVKDALSQISYVDLLPQNIKQRSRGKRGLPQILRVKVAVYPRTNHDVLEGAAFVA